MSDPVTNIEIEDVLSSIRRLVSEDTRPMKDDTPEEAVVDKLVLTPAFRVPKADDASQDDAEDASQMDALDDDLSDVVIGTNDEFREDEPVTFEFVTAVDDLEDDAEAEVLADENLEETPDFDTAPDDVVAAIDTVLQDAAIPENVEDIATPELTQDSEIDAAEPAQDPMTNIEDAFADVKPEWDDGLDDEAYDEADEVIQADTPEAAQSTVQDAWEDVDDELADENTIPFISAVRPTAAHAKVAEDITEDDPEVFLSDEAVLDEEALRDLVAELVREELQGALGERITRNVRKLVRREIHRALASMELD